MLPFKIDWVVVSGKKYYEDDIVKLEKENEQLKHRLKIAGEISKLQQEQLEKAESILQKCRSSVYRCASADVQGELDNYFKEKDE